MSLVIAQRKGRERWNHLNVPPITQIYDRWIGDYARSAATLLATLKSNLEARLHETNTHQAAWT